MDKQTKLDNHRKGHFTCPEDCWCWELEQEIMEEEIRRELEIKLYIYIEKNYPSVFEEFLEKNVHKGVIKKPTALGGKQKDDKKNM